MTRSIEREAGQGVERALGLRGAGRFKLPPHDRHRGQRDGQLGVSSVGELQRRPEGAPVPDRLERPERGEAHVRTDVGREGVDQRFHGPCAQNRKTGDRRLARDLARLAQPGAQAPDLAGGRRFDYH